MNNKSAKILIITGLFFLSLLISCQRGDIRSQRILREAQSLLDTKPDSALLLLDSIEYPQNLGKLFYNRYQLARIQAKDKSFQEINEDSVIFSVKRYFDVHGTTEEKALSSYYAGKVTADGNDYNRAFIYFSDAEGYAEELSDGYNLKGLIQFAIGRAYYRTLTSEEGRIYFRRSLESFEKAGKYNNVIIAYTAIGNSFLYSNTDSSFFYYNKALDLAQEIGANYETAQIYNSIGLAFRRQSRMQESRTALKKAIDLYEKDNDKIIAYNNIALTFVKENEDSARYYLNKALLLDPEEKDYATQRNVQRVLAGINIHNKNFEQAIYHFKLYTQYLDEEFKKRNNEQMLIMQKKYNYERLKNQNSRLAIKTKDMWIGFFFTLSVVLIIALIVIYYYIHLHRKAQKVVLEGATKLKNLSDKARAEKGSMMSFVLDHFDVLKKAALLEGYLREDEKKLGRKLLDKFNETIYGRNSFDWDKAIEVMNHIYDGFCDKLRNKYPQLDESEFRVCCLVYAGLKNPDIAIIMGYMINTVQAKKYSIRKKLGICGYGKIIDYLNKELSININPDSALEEVDESEKVD